MMKEKMKKLFIFTFVFCLLMVAVPIDTCAVSYYDLNDRVTINKDTYEFCNHISSSENDYFNYDCTIDGTTLHMKITDVIAYKNKSTWVSVVVLPMENAMEVEAEGDGDLTNSESCEITMDLSKITDGYKFLSISSNRESKYNGHFKDFLIYKKGSTIKFYSPGGKIAKKMVSDIKKYDSSKYIYIPSEWKNNKIKAKALEITKNCKTEEEKITAIYNWVCTNIQYWIFKDPKILDKINNPIGCFENRKAQCSGYAELFTVICYYNKIPSMVVDGAYLSPHFNDVRPNNKTPEVPHAWNLVYVNQEWKYLDCTMDSPNLYCGKGNPDNRSNLPPRYTHFLLDPVDMGIIYLPYYTYENPNLNDKTLTKIKAQFSSKTIKQASVSKKALKVYVNFTRNTKDGTVKYTTNSSYIKIDEKGKYITIKKGTPKGTYKISAIFKGTKNSTPATKVVKIIIQ